MATTETAADAGAITGVVQLYIDGVEIPIEVTPRGVVSQDEMMFKEYGTVDELAEDIIRQRGTAEIVKGEAPHDHHDSPE